jgi:pilus assembly protein CpaF
MSFELIRPFFRPIEPLLLDDDVSEIMGNPNATWYAEREGIMERQHGIAFESGSLRTGLEVIANNLGKRLDEDNPLLNAQLPDGSRICAYIPPAVKPAPGLTIRKFTSRHFTADDLIARGTLTASLAKFLAAEVHAGKTLLISGGTGTGKTTLLNILAQAIPDDERIVTIEDTAELLIHKPNIVPFECQTDTFKQPVTFEELLKTSLRCRPEGAPVADVLTMLEVRHRFDLSLADCRAYAVEILLAAQQEIDACNPRPIPTTKETRYAAA